jgi:hypothetical protein
MSLKSTIAGLGLFLLLFLVLGAGTAPAGDKEDIVGRWDQTGYDGLKYFRFYSDGTFKEVAPLGSSTGKYRFLSREVIELDYPGVFYGRNVMEFKYKLTGDKLELKYATLILQYERVP